MRVVFPCRGCTPQHARGPWGRRQGSDGVDGEPAPAGRCSCLCRVGRGLRGLQPCRAGAAGRRRGGTRPRRPLPRGGGAWGRARRPFKSGAGSERITPLRARAGRSPPPANSGAGSAGKGRGSAERRRRLLLPRPRLRGFASLPATGAASSPCARGPRDSARPAGCPGTEPCPAGASWR